MVRQEEISIEIVTLLKNQQKTLAGLQEIGKRIFDLKQNIKGLGGPELTDGLNSLTASINSLSETISKTSVGKIGKDIDALGNAAASAGKKQKSSSEQILSATDIIAMQAKKTGETINVLNKVTQSQKMFGLSSETTQKNVQKVSSALTEYNRSWERLTPNISQFDKAQRDAIKAIQKEQIRGVTDQLELYSEAIVKSSTRTGVFKQTLDTISGKIKNTFNNIARAWTKLSLIIFSIREIFGRYIRQLIQLVNQLAEYDKAIQHAAAASSTSTKSFREGSKSIAEMTLNIGAMADVAAGPKEAADALTILAKAGIDVSSVTESQLIPILNLSTATFTDLETTATGVVHVLNQFSLSMAESARVADVLTAAEFASTANLEDLFEGLGNIGPYAAMFGTSLEQTTAALALMVNRGLSAAEAGTSLKNVFTQLAAPTPKLTAGLEKFGLAVEDIDPRIHDLTDTVKTFSEAGVKGADIFELFGMRASRAFSIIVDQAPSFERLTKLLEQSSGFTETITRRVLKTFSGAVTVFKKQFDTVVKAVLQAYMPILREILMKTQPVLEDLVYQLIEFGKNSEKYIKPEMFESVAEATQDVANAVLRLVETITPEEMAKLCDTISETVVILVEKLPAIVGGLASIVKYLAKIMDYAAEPVIGALIGTYVGGKVAGPPGALVGGAAGLTAGSIDRFINYAQSTATNTFTDLKNYIFAQSLTDTLKFFGILESNGEATISDLGDSAEREARRRLRDVRSAFNETFGEAYLKTIDIESNIYIPEDIKKKLLQSVKEVSEIDIKAEFLNLPNVIGQIESFKTSTDPLIQSLELIRKGEIDVNEWAEKNAKTFGLDKKTFLELYNTYQQLFELGPELDGIIKKWEEFTEGIDTSEMSVDDLNKLLDKFWTTLTDDQKNALKDILESNEAFKKLVGIVTKSGSEIEETGEKIQDAWKEVPDMLWSVVNAEMDLFKWIEKIATIKIDTAYFEGLLKTAYPAFMTIIDQAKLLYNTLSSPEWKSALSEFGKVFQDTAKVIVEELLTEKVLGALEVFQKFNNLFETLAKTFETFENIAKFVPPSLLDIEIGFRSLEAFLRSLVEWMQTEPIKKLFADLAESIGSLATGMADLLIKTINFPDQFEAVQKVFESISKTIEMFAKTSEMSLSKPLVGIVKFTAFVYELAYTIKALQPQIIEGLRLLSEAINPIAKEVENLLTPFENLNKFLKNVNKTMENLTGSTLALVTALTLLGSAKEGVNTLLGGVTEGVKGLAGGIGGAFGTLGELAPLLLVTLGAKIITPFINLFNTIAADITESIKALNPFEIVSNTINDVVKRSIDLLFYVPDKIKEIATTVINKITDTVFFIPDLVTETVSNIVDKLISIATFVPDTLMKATTDILERIIDALFLPVDMFTETISDVIGKVTDALFYSVDFIEDFLGNLTKKVTDVLFFGYDTLTDFIKQFTDLVLEIYSLPMKPIEDLTKGLTDTIMKIYSLPIDTLTKGIESITSSLVKFISLPIDEFASFTEQLMNSIINTLTLSLKIVEDSLTTIVESFTETLTTPLSILADSLTKIYSSFIDVLIIPLSTASNSIQKFSESLIDFAVLPLTTFSDLVNKVTDSILGFLTLPLTSLTESIDSVINKFIDFASLPTTLITTSLTNLADKFTELLSTPFDIITSSLNKLGETLLSFVTLPIDQALKSVSDIVDAVLQYLTLPITEVIKVWSDILGTFTNLWMLPMNLVTSGITSIVDKLVELLNLPIVSIIDTLTNIFKSITDLLNLPIESVIELTKEVINVISSLITSPFEEVINNIKEILDILNDMIIPPLRELSSLLQSIISPLEMFRNFIKPTLPSTGNYRSPSPTFNITFNSTIRSEADIDQLSNVVIRKIEEFSYR